MNLLLKYGANPDLKDNDGVDARKLARFHPRMLASMDAKEVLTSVIDVQMSCIEVIQSATQQLRPAHVVCNVKTSTVASKTVGHFQWDTGGLIVLLSLLLPIKAVVGLPLT